MEYNGVTLTEEMIWVLAIVAIISYTVRGFYCHTIKRTLDLISEDNRCMQPKMAWLAIIPLFSIYWNFIIATQMSDSLTNEFYDRKIPEEENPGRKTGLTYSTLIALANFPFFPSFAVALALVSIVYFIKYWIKVDNFRVLLKKHNRHIAYRKDHEEHEIK